MASLRAAASCIGLSGPVSVVHDFFGFWTSGPRPLSLRTQLARLRDKHVHLNFIATGLLPAADRKSLDSGLQAARDILSKAGIGIGRVEHFAIVGDAVFDSNYVMTVDSQLVDELSGGWSVPNDGIDAFVAHEVLGSASGSSLVGGSCDKSGKNSGILIGASDLSLGYDPGLVIAHELGHFFGLEHYFVWDFPKPPVLINNNLMCFMPFSYSLFPWQIWMMRRHCSMRAGCAL